MLQTAFELLPFAWWPALMDCDRDALHEDDLHSLNQWLESRPQYWDAISSDSKGVVGVFNGAPRDMLMYEFRLN